MLLCYEVTRDLPLEMTEIETPLQTMMAPQIGGKKLVFAPILRAGLGFARRHAGARPLCPRRPYRPLPRPRDPHGRRVLFQGAEDVADRLVIVIDPMLATANSAIAAVERLKERACRTCASSACWPPPRASPSSTPHHPDVGIWTASIDSHLNDHGYIVPGLGDAATACSARSSAFGRIWRGRSTGWGASSPPAAGPRVGILLFPDVEVLDSPGPSRSSRWRTASRGGRAGTGRRLRCRDCRRRTSRCPRPPWAGRPRHLRHERRPAV